MATENSYFNTTIAAGADYSAPNKQYHAFAVADGQLANNAEEASGILLNKPASGAFAAIGYLGEMKFAAGGAVAKGAKVTVTESGWFISADSYDTIVGESKAAVASGSVGVGFFEFANTTDRTQAIALAVGSNGCPLLAGIAFCLDEALVVADNGKEAAAVAPDAVTSGTASDLLLWGKVNVRCDPAKVCSAGDLLTVTTSGYFIPCDSGYYACARALANIGSNAVGAAFFDGFRGYLPA